MALADQNVSSSNDRWTDFSLMGGGPLHRLARSLGLPPGFRGFVDLGVALALLAWVPLFVLCALGGTLTSGPTVPFIESVATHARLLVAIPLFFFAEAAFDVRVRQAIRTIVTSQLVPERQFPLLAASLAKAKRWRDSWVTELALALLTLVFLWKGWRTELPPDISTWRHTAGALTAAGWWYDRIVVPVFQFLMLRWGARLSIWGYVLWRIRGLDLQLVPTHPDLSGGLGGLGVAHVSLGPLNFALSAILVGGFVEQLWYGKMTVDRAALPLAAAVVGQTLMLVAPLLLFAPRLIDAKQRGMLEYGNLAADYTRAFDAKWLRSRTPPTEHLLGSADLQSLADLASSYDVIRSMRIAPITGSQIVLLAGAAALPALPLIFFVIPLEELILRSVRGVLHL